MTTVTASEARLPSLLEEVIRSHEPIQITGECGSGVLVSEDDWRAIQETLHLLSVPGMRESILEGLTIPVEGCAKEPGW